MKFYFISIILFISVIANAQTSYYTPPLKIPLYLSGSFAELRSNHFHSGIDIKTQGVTGLPVYSVADGYVSRVAVSPTGYGNALYINHPNGTTSVYGHLSKFSAKIAEYVKNKQYEQQSFKVDLQIPVELFPVKKGEIVARSGNSGSSGGPHLHFEIRDTQTEEPTNVLDYGFPVKDNIAPKIFSVLLVPLDQYSHVNYQNKPQSFPVVFYDGKYHLKSNPKIPIWGKIGIGIKCNDYLNGTNNRCGIHDLQLFVNNEEQFSFKLNRFAFSDSRYINSHIIYSEYVTTKKRYIKTWLQPGNHLPIYSCNDTKGVLSPHQDFTQIIDIRVADSYGNNAVLDFSVIGKKKEMPVKVSNSTLFAYNQENYFEDESFSITIPEGALYEDLNFEYHTELTPSSYYSPFYYVQDKTVPLHKRATIDIKPDKLPEELQSKAIIVNVDPNSGHFHSIGGEYKNGVVETKTRIFGVYAVSADTIAPKIAPLSIKNNALTESNRIRFKITDDLSGIKTYEGLIDGQWVLFEYDPRINRITHYFDKNRLELGKRHTFKLTVTDAKNNSSVYECTFWK